MEKIDTKSKEEGIPMIQFRVSLQVIEGIRKHAEKQEILLKRKKSQKNLFENV